jgi:hypothetical protein
MARLRSDQQKEADDCHYVVTLLTQIVHICEDSESRDQQSLVWLREIYPKGIVLVGGSRALTPLVDANSAPLHTEMRQPKGSNQA